MADVGPGLWLNLVPNSSNTNGGKVIAVAQEIGGGYFDSIWSLDILMKSSLKK